MEWEGHEYTVRTMLNPGRGEIKPLAHRLKMPYSTVAQQFDGHRALSLKLFWCGQAATKNWSPLQYLLGLSQRSILEGLETEPEAPNLYHGLVRVGQEMGHLYASVENAIDEAGPGGSLITKEELAQSEQMANRMHAQIDAVMRSMRKQYQQQFSSGGRQFA